MNIVAAILIGAFIAGFLVAGKWCENIFLQFIVGIAFGVGFIAILCGVAFAGCMLVMGNQHF